MYRRLLIFILSLVVCCIGGVSAYAEGNSDSANANDKLIRFKASIPEDIVFENEISVQLENTDSGDVSAYAITADNDYVSLYVISNGKYRITSARVMGEYEGEFKCSFPEEPFAISGESEVVTEIPIKVEFIAKGHADESASVSLAGTDEESDTADISSNDSEKSDSIDEKEEKEPAVNRHEKNQLASLCITLGVLSCLGAGYFIYKARNESV